MSKYDGLIIPRSYSEYINKTDAATLQQALQLNNVLAQNVAANDNRAVTSNAVNGAITDLVSFNLIGKESYSGDLNSIKAGVYRVSDSATNLPVSAWGYLTCIVRDESSYAIQTYYAENNITYQRICVFGIWSAWQELAIQKTEDISNLITPINPNIPPLYELTAVKNGNLVHIQGRTTPTANIGGYENMYRLDPSILPKELVLNFSFYGADGKCYIAFIRKDEEKISSRAALPANVMLVMDLTYCI